MKTSMLALVVIGAFLVVVPAASYAAEVNASCYKLKVTGDASTYNPNVAGWRTGGQGLATGGRYNPNEFEAALQLGLARQVSCGYGAGKVCNAVVETTNGLAAVVRINDNGPLVDTRVIDLKEKSMRYLSGEKYGNNSGVLKNVTVTVLCNSDQAFVGPLDEADRQAWLKKTFDIPSTYAGNVGGTPGFTTSPGSIGSTMPSSFNGASQNPYGSSASTIGANGQPTGSSYLLNSTNPSTGTQTQTQNQGIPGPAISGIFVQSKKVSPGQTILVAWTSVNMVPNSCVVRLGSQQITTANEGSKLVKASGSGTQEFTLTCVEKTGQSRTVRDTVSVQ